MHVSCYTFIIIYIKCILKSNRHSDILIWISEMGYSCYSYWALPLDIKEMRGRRLLEFLPPPPSRSAGTWHGGGLPECQHWTWEQWGEGLRYGNSVPPRDAGGNTALPRAEPLFPGWFHTSLLAFILSLLFLWMPSLLATGHLKPLWQGQASVKLEILCTDKKVTGHGRLAHGSLRWVSGKLFVWAAYQGDLPSHDSQPRPFGW